MMEVALRLTACVWRSEMEDCVVPVILLACLMMRDSLDLSLTERKVYQDEML